MDIKIIVLFCAYYYLFINSVIADSIPCNKFKLKNGRMRLRQKSKIARFVCNKGFTLVGQKFNYCLNGKFEVPPPICIKPTCGKIKGLTNGLLLPSYNGAVITFYCKPDFKILGNNMTYCDGTKWSQNLPTCIKSGEEPLKYCDFESEDWCGWSHDLNHDFDWRRQNYETPSGHIFTGPKYDHTKGPKKDGYYVYIESTSRLLNDTARLISPVYKNMSKLCFTFYYHMFGLHMGTLRVYIKKESDIFEKLSPLFVVSGNQGDVWKKHSIWLPNGIQENFQVILEGIRGANYTSDIAVDDVLLSETCSEEQDDFFSSTTTDITFGESSYLPQLDSCENRCGINDTLILKKNCECIETCHEMGTCCEDYYAICILSSSLDFFEDYETTTDFSNTDDVSSNSDTITTIKNNIHETTVLKLSVKPDINIKSTESIPVILTTQTTITEKPTTKKIIPKITTIAPTTTIKTKLNKTTSPTTTTKQTIIKTTSPATTKQIIIKTKPPIITKQTIPKIKTSTSKKESTTIESTKIIYTFPSSIEIETDYEKNKSLTLKPNVQFLLQNSKSKIPKATENKSSLLFVSIISIVVILCSVILIVFIVKKYNLGFRKMKFRNSRHSDSMSDVRFLASDEGLDFTWRRADN